jgi:hypothetical protein
MLWLALLLVAVVILEMTHRERAVGLAMLLAALGFILSLGALNVDAFIVERNIQREVDRVQAHVASQDGAALDAQYFLDLSDDAVPSLVDAYHDKTLPDPVREEVAASLTCIRYTRDQDMRELPWPSFHFSRYSADQALETVNKDLDAYQIDDEDLPVIVNTPGGQEFSCLQYYYD